MTGEGGDAVLSGMSDAERARRRVYAKDGLSHLGITGPYVLILGTVEPRKHIDFILNFWPSIASRFPDVSLVIAGHNGWKTASTFQKIEELSKKCRIVRLKDFGDEKERHDLFFGASLTLVPSQSEGFGLVALESTQAGTPCLMSRAGALPELFGEGPWLLPVDDERAWREAIIRIFSDDVFASNIVSTQRNLSKTWTWKKAGEKIVEGIQKIA